MKPLSKTEGVLHITGVTSNFAAFVQVRVWRSSLW